MRTQEGELEEWQGEFFARCVGGLESTLAQELKALRVHQVRPLKGGVSFVGSLKDAYRVCLWSRCATRIQLVLARIDAYDAEGLFAGAYAFPWEEHVRTQARIAIHAHGENANLRNTHFSSLVVKDALCDRLRDKMGWRPDVDVAHADFRVDVAIHAERATLYLNLSGAPLDDRGYRNEDSHTSAASKETLAAGLLIAAGWDKLSRRGAAFVDPWCGNGVLAIEAALMACDVAPGLQREHWGFEGWARHDKDLWDALHHEAEERAAAGKAALGAGRIIAANRSLRAVDFARANAQRAGVADAISFFAAPAASVTEAMGNRAKAAAAKRASGKDGSADVGERVNSKAQAGAQGKAASAQGALTLGLMATCLPVGKAPDRKSDDRGQAARRADGQKARDRNAFDRKPAGGKQPAADQAEKCAALANELARAQENIGWGWNIAVLTPDASIDDVMGLAPDRSFDCRMGAVEMTMRVYAADARQPLDVVSLSGESRTVPVYEKNSEQFAARLRKVAKARMKWARRAGVSCFRIYDADLPDYAVSIDLYEDPSPDTPTRLLRIVEYQAPSSVDADRATRRFADARSLAPAILDMTPDQVFCKVRRHAKGGGQYREAQSQPHIAYTQEGGYRFEIDLNGRLDTGLFLDHRDTRAYVGRLASGKCFLNLFAYTGSATVHAAGGGAATTTTVDLSQTYLDWAQRNMRMNGFSGASHRFIRADVKRWLDQAAYEKGRYDLVFCDPPTFSNSNSKSAATFDVQRDHVGLLRRVGAILDDEGLIVFSCNLRRFKLDESALAEEGLVARVITARTIPADFERNAKAHHCFLVAKNEAVIERAYALL